MSIPADYIALFMENETTWCAVREGFEDLAVSPVGFGATPTEAVDDLLENELK